MSDVTFDMQENRMEVHRRNVEPWRVTLVDTGEQTLTGGRLRRVREYVKDEEFCLTYGDGVGDINVTALIEFHKSQGKPVTLTAVQPPGRFGALNLEGAEVRSLEEKPKGDGSWINGGFFVLSPSVIDSIRGDDTMWEAEPMENLTAAGVNAHIHDGFWQPTDTLLDKNRLDRSTLRWRLTGRPRGRVLRYWRLANTGRDLQSSPIDMHERRIHPTSPTANRRTTSFGRSASLTALAVQGSCIGTNTQDFGNSDGK